MISKPVAIGSTIFILLVGFFAAAFVFPSYTNRGIDFLNEQKEAAPVVNLLPSLPRVPDVPFQLGLDLQGGLRIIYEADLERFPEEEHEERMEGIRDVIQFRIDFFGVREPVVQVQGSGTDQRLVVELPGVTALDEVDEMLMAPPTLEFKELLPIEERRELFQMMLAEEGEGEQFTDAQIDAFCQNEGAVAEAIFSYQADPCFQDTLLSGEHLDRADWRRDEFQPGHYPVGLTFNREGAELFAELTGQNLQRPIAIYLDGFPIQIATVQERITGGQAQITGIRDQDFVRQLVRNLNAGALPVEIRPISHQTVGATLGEASLRDSLAAGIGGFGVVLLFMALFYRLPGIIAGVALFFYVAVLLMLFKVLGVTLTLAGIAGIILSIGMAVDANILIFSRLREELRDGKSYSAALIEGFRRAWPSIRDGNLTTLLVMFILFFLGSAFVQGFAFALSIGIVLSMITAMLVTRVLLSVFEHTKLAEVKKLWVP